MAVEDGRAAPGRAPRVVFVDRDGVINANRADHVKSWAEFTFLPGALDALALLRDHGWRVAVLTNQAIVNRGIIRRAELDSLHQHMLRKIAEHGGEVEAVFVCPHRPEEGCSCRKPAPGLLLAAAARLALQPREAVLVGDHASDLEAAARAGCRSIFVLSGRGAEADGLPDGCVAVVPDLAAAARLLVSEQSPGSVGVRPTGEARTVMAAPNSNQGCAEPPARGEMTWGRQT